MKLFFALFCLLSLAAAVGAPKTKLYFVFLTKGNGTRPDQATLQAYQKAHIGNFERRFKEGKLIGAGPLNDPTTVRRGIVVLTLPSEAEVPKAFEGDPYVEHRIMNVEAWEWDADRSRINVNLPDPNAIQENRLVVFHATEKGLPTESLVTESRRRLDRYAAVCGRLKIPGEYRAIALFEGKDEAHVRAVVEADPLVLKGYAKPEVLPLWMAKEVLKAPQPE